MATPKPSTSFATNASTKFKDFSLRLRNGATLTGIAYIPTVTSITPARRPLIVGIHGGTCCAHNYDMSPEYTASIYCDLLGIPFVAFNRPNYLGSSGWVVDRASDSPTQPRFQRSEDSYFEEEGRWFCDLIFPAIWDAFAVPNGCTALVTNSHSLGVIGSIIAGSMYAELKGTGEVEYDWAGMILSGLTGSPTEEYIAATSTLSTNVYTPDQLPPGFDQSIHQPPWYPRDKQALMLGLKEDLFDAELRELVSIQTTPLFQIESTEAFTWPEKKAQYMAGVKMPVLYANGDHDWILKCDREGVESFAAGFTASPRVEAALVKRAAHAIELMKVGRGWWIRTFGWAIEVAGACV